MTTLTDLWRYPIKGHGRERLQTVALRAGKTMPGDRVWAVAHEAATTDGGAWAPCANFSRGAKAPQLMAIEATLHEDADTVTLSHPQIGSGRFEVADRIERCMAATANPTTGERDADTLAALENNWGHTDMGLHLSVLTDGEIALGDSLRVR